MPQFLLERDGTRLRLSAPEASHENLPFPAKRLDFLSYTAELEMAGLAVTVGVFDLLPSGIAFLFAEMEEKWRGWEGALHGRALEGQLTLEATRDGIGHVFLKISLCDNAFRVETVMTLDSGDLSRLAIMAKKFFTIVECDSPSA